MITIKRIYDPPADSDGYRVLVDRLWPRGVKRKTAALDAWLKDLAPSPELRTWFSHDPARWTEFQRRYRAELRAPGAGELLADLRRRARSGPVTLLYAARSPEQNSASILQTVLEGAR